MIGSLVCRNKSLFHKSEEISFQAGYCCSQGINGVSKYQGIIMHVLDGAIVTQLGKLGTNIELDLDEQVNRSRTCEGRQTN